MAAASTVTLSAAGTFKYGSYNSKAKTCAITAYEGDDTKTITIPDKHKHDGVAYTVTAVNDSVFIGLKSLTTVNIGPYLTRIGKSGTIYDATNFIDCPNLKKFSVDAKNPNFASSPGGILTCESQLEIYRVPPKISATNGVLNLSERAAHINKGAFRGVTTVTTLNLRRVSGIINNGGLNDAPNLKKITVDSENEILSVTESGLLVELYFENAYIVSLPPKSAATSIKIPTTISRKDGKSNVCRIETKAFANCTNLESVSLPSTLTEIESDAFAGSGITGLSIPAKTETLGDGMLAGCSNLTKIIFNSKKPYLPNNFARGSRKLTTLTFKNGVPTSMRQSAFKNCTSLTSFPFNAVQTVADSVFANTGFKKVVFEKNANRGGWAGSTGLFSGCRELTKIDMSAEEAETIRKGFASHCPKLATILFPTSVTIHKQTFGINNNLTKIVLGNFTLPDGPVFGYSEDASPSLYIVTKKTWPDLITPLGGLLKPSSGAKITPRVYTDAWTLVKEYSHPDYPGDNTSPIKGATIYIPALASDNYKRYAKSSKVTEMFTLSLTRSGSKTRLEYRPVVSGVKFSSINLGNGSSITLNPEGAVKTVDIPYSDIKTVTLSYSVNGVEMMTRYPKSAFNNMQTDIDDVTDGAALQLHLDGRLARFGNEAAYTVAGINGIVVLSGEGTEADLSQLPAGIYIINACGGQSSITEKIALH